MPTYDYRCVDCKARYELHFHSTHERLEHHHCSACGGELERLPSAPAFALRGSGFHKNDYPAK